MLVDLKGLWIAHDWRQFVKIEPKEILSFVYMCDYASDMIRMNIEIYFKTFRQSLFVGATFQHFDLHVQNAVEIPKLKVTKRER